MLRPHVYTTGPMLQLHHNTTSDHAPSTSSWFSRSPTKTDDSVLPSSTQILVSNIDLKDTSSVQSMITGLNHVRMLLQTYAERVCSAVHEHAVPGSSSYNRLHEECRELTEIANFTVTWVTRCNQDKITTRQCGDSSTNGHCAAIECVPAEIQKFLPNFVSVYHGEKQPLESHLSAHSFLYQLNQSPASKKGKTPTASHKTRTIAAISSCSARNIHVAIAYRIPVACVPTSREELDVAAQLLDLKLGMVLSSSFNKPNNLHVEEFFSLSNQLSDVMSELLVGKSSASLEKDDPVMVMIEDILPHWEFSSTPPSRDNGEKVEDDTIVNLDGSPDNHVLTNEEEEGVFLIQSYRQNVATFLVNHPLMRLKNGGASQATYILGQVSARAKQVKEEWMEQHSDDMDSDGSTLESDMLSTSTVIKYFLLLRDWWLDVPKPACGFVLGEHLWLQNEWNDEIPRGERVALHVRKGYDLYLMILAVFILSSTAAVAICCYLLF
jgi:hypothetical protein